ncbi:MAG: hypothetical protein CMH62_01850 [Nanoarchaeota archaeon]|nr:hypothetical protein [Nanoarchaeota archaeon]|tara:strand:+ start:1207 stop:1671 length:465 start_codon:yes stop_codon:yes gene_type:complete
MLDPFDEIRKFHKEMNKLVNQFFSRPSVRLLKEDGKNLVRKPLHKIMQPISSVSMKGNTITAVFDMPGINKKDIDLTVTEDYLEVKVKNKSSSKTKKKNVSIVESAVRSYYRIIPFPTMVDIKTAKANFKNGVLEVKVTKSKSKRAKAKKVSIK